MSKAYEELLKISNECRLDYFVMAISYLFDIGYIQASGITDKQIEDAEPNGLMKKDFVEWLMKTARRITEVTECSADVIQFCMAEDVFDTKYFAGKPGRGDLEEMIRNRIEYEPKNISDEEDAEYFEERYGCDIEDFELLGYKVKHEA